MPLSFYPTRQQTQTLAMVVDGTRIPAPSPSRSRLSRPTQPSRIPPPRSNTSTPRRPIRQSENSHTPSSIPGRNKDTSFASPRNPATPRNDLRSPRDPRKQKDFSSPRDPRLTPLRRTPVKPTDRTDPPSNRTPRRTGTTLRPHEERTQRTAIPAPRRMSKEPPQRIGVPRYGSRLSANSQEPPKSRARTTADPSSRMGTQNSTPSRMGTQHNTPSRMGAQHNTPSRMGAQHNTPSRMGAQHITPSRMGTQHTTPSRMGTQHNTPSRMGTQHKTLPQPSSRRLSNTTRPGLSPSPYARRVSNGGNIRTMAGVTPRRLNMTQTDDERRLSNTSARRISAAKDRLADRVEPRRESLTGTRRGMTALESFRAARRASLEAAEKKKQEDTGDIVMTDATPTPNPVDVPLHSAGVSAVTSAPVPALEQTLPDRQDPLGLGSVPLTPSGKPRRKSTRFSEADICLDGVEKLRKSLGRRRSVGYGEPIPEDMETPTLRRSSIGERLKLQAELEKQEEAERQAALERESQRLPLGSLESNKENMQSVDDKTEKRRSIIPTLEGDEFDWTNEDVEDLGP